MNEHGQSENSVPLHLRVTPRGFFSIGAAVDEVYIQDSDLPCEPIGSSQLATGSVRKPTPFWRTFTKSSLVLSWIEKGYELQWINGAAPPKIVLDAIAEA
jgi:hypothetical protein